MSEAIGLAMVLEGVIAISSEIVPAPIELRNMMAYSRTTLPPHVEETHFAPVGSTSASVAGGRQSIGV